jgi:hypothetical protein
MMPFTQSIIDETSQRRLHVDATGSLESWNAFPNKIHPKHWHDRLQNKVPLEIQICIHTLIGIDHSCYPRYQYINGEKDTMLVFLIGQTDPRTKFNPEMQAC